MHTQTVQRAQKYETLPPEHIRIAHFCKSKEGRLHGTLESIQLADLPNVLYTALSYACQDGCPTRTIALNGQKAVIRRTLYDALFSLMSTSKVSKLSLWADEICINQNDGEEKRDQMSLMSEIYGQATKVVGWLGLPSDDSDLAFEVLRIYSTLGPNQSVANKIKMKSLMVSPMLKDYFTHREGLEEVFDLLGRPAQAVETLLRRDWFHRLWVVQEAALARTLVLRCGSRELSGDDFFKGVKIRGFENLSDPPMPSLQAPYRNAYYISIARDAFRERSNLPLAHLAHMFGRWECTEAVDRLNSLFGLAYRDYRNDPIIAPSSTTEPAKLYHEFAVQSIYISRHLDILHFAGLSDLPRIDGNNQQDLQGLTSNLPSWVPDWRLQCRPLHSLNPTASGSAFNCTSSRAETPFIADKHRTDSPASLEVNAVKLDSVDHVCPTYWPSFDDRGMPAFVKLILIWYKEVQKHLSSDDVDEAFSSTLIMGGRLSLIEHPGLAVDPNRAAACFKRFKMMCVNSCTMPVEDATDEYLVFLAYAEEVCRYRSLFITKKGRLGLGFAYVPQGSSIYAIHGLKTPFVVDRRGRNNTLRGECYIDGAMELGLLRSSGDVRLTLS